MNTNLIMYDIDLFLEKYTRFMTKDIYISKHMYDNFLKSYDYLYEKLKKDAILYRENPKFKKIFEIKEKSTQILKLHNQKYLKKNLEKFTNFFNNIKNIKELDNNQKYIILSNEQKMLLINNKNIDSLIIGKIKYLIEVLKIKSDKIFVLTPNSTNLEELLKENNLNTVNIVDSKTYIENILKDKTIIENNTKYDILLDYIMTELFKNKEKFQMLYEAFINNIYLNEDYLEYETFNDYHSYMYKRKFLSSKLSLNRFIDKEIEKRKKYLRTLKNELVQTKEEIEIANYLALNQIPYKYIYLDQVFVIKNEKKGFKLKVINKEEDILLKKNYTENTIYLNKNLILNNNYQEIIDEELNEKLITKNKIKIEDVYDILKNSMMDNYFSEFINKYLIKYLDYYDLNQSFNETKLNQEQTNILIYIYKYYKEYLIKNNLITNKELSKLIEDNINNNNYKYVILNTNINLDLKSPYLKIIEDYKEIDLIKENIKLLYDYKKYLHENKILVPVNIYIDELEINNLTKLFLNKNLNVINSSFINNKKKISLYLYEDNNRLLTTKNIAKTCYEVVRKNNDILIGVNSVNNINTLVYKDSFTKYASKKLIINNSKIIDCEEILKIRKNYERIILPFLILDTYHEDLTINNNNYNIKLMIYTSLSKCREELIILVPKTKKKEVLKILKKVKNISIFE